MRYNQVAGILLLCFGMFSVALGLNIDAGFFVPFNVNILRDSAWFFYVEGVAIFLAGVIISVDEFSKSA